MKILPGLLFGLLLLGGCEDVDILRATDAGVDAVKAITLSDATVRELASQAAGFADGEHQVAPPESGYAQRLAKLTAGHLSRTAIGLTARCIWHKR
jgi:metalloprotease